MNTTTMAALPAESSVDTMGPTYSETEPARSIHKREPKLVPAFFKRTTWRAFAYHWAMLFLVPFGFAYAILTISLGASLLVTIVGLSIAAAMLIGARSWGRLQRALAGSGRCWTNTLTPRRGS